MLQGEDEQEVQITEESDGDASGGDARCRAREEKVALRPSATIARGQQVVAF